MNRARVLFLPPPVRLKIPWERDVVSAVSPRHDLLTYDPNSPLAPQFDGIDVVIDFGGSMGTREMADVSGTVRLWQILGNGIDHFDLEYWRAKGISVAHCPGDLTGAPLAECALMFMLMLSRRWSETQTSLHRGTFYEPMGEELEGRLLGLVGFGATARQLALRARAFGMRIRALDVREIDRQEQEQFGLEFVGDPADLDQFVSTSDFLSLHLHLNEQTRHIINDRRIRLMKRGAFLINVSRGALVDEESLYHALVDNHLGGAGLDVFSREPLNPDDLLFGLPNVIVTPHISGNTVGTSRRRAAFAAKNVDLVASACQPLGLLNERADAAVYRNLTVDWPSIAYVDSTPDGARDVALRETKPGG